MQHFLAFRLLNYSVIYLAKQITAEERIQLITKEYANKKHKEHQIKLEFRAKKKMIEIKN